MVKLISEYLDLIITILTSVGIIVGLLGQLFKNKKLVDASNRIKLYTDLVEKHMVVVEKMDNLKGEEKLKYVISMVSSELNEKGIEVDIELITQIIEHIIDISKNVNYKK